MYVQPEFDDDLSGDDLDVEDGEVFDDSLKTKNEEIPK